MPLGSKNVCLAGVTTIALALRLLSLEQLGDSPLIEVAVGEARAYAALGAPGAAAPPDGTEPAPSPIYAAILSHMDGLGGTGGLRWMQAIAGAISCALVATLGLAVAGTAGGWWAGLLAAGYGPALLYGVELTPATVAAVTALAALVLLLGAIRREDDRMMLVAAGVASGAAAVADARLALFVPGALAWLLLSRRGRLAPALAFALPSLGLTAVGRGWAWQSLQLPGLGEAVERLRLSWHGAEILPDLNPYGAGFGSWLLDLLVWDRVVAFPFALVAPLAVAGMLLHTGSRPAAEVLLLVFVATAALGALWAAPSARGRLPLALALLPWVGIAAVEGPRRLRGAPARGIALVAAVLVAVASSAGASSTRARAEAAHQRWLVYAYEQLGMPTSAIAVSEEAVASGVAPADAYRDLARLYASAGMASQSVTVLRRLTERWPAESSFQLELGDRLMGAGRARDAEAAYRQAMAIGADPATLGGRLGDALAAQRDEDGAMRAFQSLLEAYPDSHRVRFRVASMLEEAGRTTDAATHYRQLVESLGWEIRAGVQLAAIQIRDPSLRRETERLLRRLLAEQPDLQPALWTLSTLLHDEGRHEEALVPLTRLRDIDPEDPWTHRLLASAYARLGRDAEADEAYGIYRRLERQAAIHRSVEAQAMDWARKVGQQ